mgnify:CR=1 FL=1
MTQHFDDLSKALASGMSRRSALKAFGLSVAGAAAATLLPGRASGATKISSTLCNRFCDAYFGEETPLSNACKIQAKKGVGACYQWGPQSSECRSGGNSYCSHYKHTVCSTSFINNTNASSAPKGAFPSVYCLPTSDT